MLDPENTKGKEKMPICALVLSHIHTHVRSRALFSFSYLPASYLFLSFKHSHLSFTNRPLYYPQKTVAIIKAILPWKKICQNYLAHTLSPYILTFAKLGEKNRGRRKISLTLDLEDPLPHALSSTTTLSYLFYHLS